MTANEWSRTNGEIRGTLTNSAGGTCLLTSEGLIRLYDFEPAEEAGHYTAELDDGDSVSVEDSEDGAIVRPV